MLGRPVNTLLHIYMQNRTLSLSEYVKLSDKVSVSIFDKLSLKEYCIARNHYCLLHHSPPCHECSAMIQAATSVLDAGICSLQQVFKSCFPSVTYHTVNAKRRLLQMPLVAIQIESEKCTEVVLTELVEGIDYLKLVHFLNGYAHYQECFLCTFLIQARTQ